jgi:pimeloyl-ACP methyl ester carboxylesterase
VRRLTETEASIPPPAAGERDTVADGVRWRSREAPGDKPDTVVYVHGFLSSSVTWKRVLQTASAGHPAIAVDLPGSGFSDRPWPYDYTVGAQALHLSRYLDTRGLGRVILVGNSLGGAVALVAAAVRPDRVAALVLVDSPSPGLSVPLPFRVMRAPVAGEIEMELLCRPTMAWALRYRVFSRPERVTDEVIADWWDPIPVPGTRRAALAAIRSRRDEYRDATGRIAAPTLVVWGEGDRILPTSEGLRVSREIRGSALLTIPDAGHVPQEEKPEAFSKAVGDFLRALPAGGKDAPPTAVRMNP